MISGTGCRRRYRHVPDCHERPLARPDGAGGGDSGKDVYVEKPLGLSLEERPGPASRLHRKKRVFQFGTQQRSSRNFPVCLRIGAQWHAGQASPHQPLGARRHARRSVKQKPAPAELDYDFWLGRPPRRLTRRIARLRRRLRSSGTGSRTTRSASSPAGAFTRWTSRFGVEASWRRGSSQSNAAATSVLRKGYAIPQPSGRRITHLPAASR